MHAIQLLRAVFDYSLSVFSSASERARHCTTDVPCICTASMQSCVRGFSQLFFTIFHFKTCFFIQKIDLNKIVII